MALAQESGQPLRGKKGFEASKPRHTHGSSRALPGPALPTKAPEAEALRLVIRCQPRYKRRAIILCGGEAMPEEEKNQAPEMGEAPAGEDAILDTAGAAALLGVAESTVRQLANAGRLPGVKLGPHWRFSRHALLGWVAGSGGRAVSFTPVELRDVHHAIARLIASCARDVDALQRAGVRDTRALAQALEQYPSSSRR
jgi:excisionase family DNA binding protein